MSVLHSSNVKILSTLITGHLQIKRASLPEEFAVTSCRQGRTSPAVITKDWRQSQTTLRTEPITQFSSVSQNRLEKVVEHHPSSSTESEGKAAGTSFLFLEELVILSQMLVPVLVIPWHSSYLGDKNIGNPKRVCTDTWQHCKIVILPKCHKTSVPSNELFHLLEDCMCDLTSLRFAVLLLRYPEALPDSQESTPLLGKGY